MVEENMDNISIIRRKEIKGKVEISIGYLEKGKDSSEEPFADAKEDMTSGISADAVYREISLGNPVAWFGS